MKATATKASKKSVCNSVLLDLHLLGDEWEDNINKQSTYAWCVTDSIQNSMTTYFFAPIVSTKKQAQITNLDSLKEARAFIEQHHCTFPVDYEEVSAGAMMRHHKFVVVHEPMLCVNSIEVFAERVKTLTQKGQKNIHTRICIDSTIDTVLFVLEIVRAVFDLRDIASDSLFLARKNTVHHNLSQLVPPVTTEQLRPIYDVIEDATENKDATYYIEKLHLLLNKLLSASVYTKTIQCVQHKDFTLLPYSRFGVVQSKHHIVSPLDYLLQDLTSTFTFVSTVTVENSTPHDGIYRLYEDKIMPLFESSHINMDRMFSLSDFYIQVQLNMNINELLLYQIFLQLHQDDTVPVLSIWNDDAVVKRQLIQLRYFEKHLGELPVLLQDYSNYVLAHDSSMKVEHETDRQHVETMDFVLSVGSHYYLFTLDYNGVLTCSVNPLRSLQGCGHDDSTSMFKFFVSAVVPKCNAFIDRINRLHYAIPGHTNTTPSLLKVHMKWDVDHRQIRCARNVRVNSYSANYRENATKKAIAVALEHMQHFVIPLSLARCETVSVKAFVSKNVQGKSLHNYCNGVLDATTNNEFGVDMLSHNMKLTLFNSHLVSRYRLRNSDVHPHIKHMTILQMNTEDDEMKMSLTSCKRKHYKRNIQLHPKSFTTFAVLFSHSLRMFLSESASSSSSQTFVWLCPIPFVSSNSEVVLKNMEYIFKTKYIKHKNTAQSNNKYANVCQRPKQPWCVTSPHVHNMRRWCRYACISADYDYWIVKTFRKYLNLLEDNAIYNGPFASKYMNLQKTHDELVHNYCRLIKLTMCKTTHNIIANTFKQLIVTVAEVFQNESLNVETYTMNMVMSNARDYGKYDKMLNTMLRILKEAYPNEEYNQDFDRLTSWAKIFYAVRRFAELFVYLRHPTEKTTTCEDIYYCSPIYICTHCKTPLSNPESPEYYYADPVSLADIEEAMQYSHKLYNDKPIVEASYRLTSKHNKDDCDYPYGDLNDTHMEDIKWMCTPAVSNDSESTMSGTSSTNNTSSKQGSKTTETKTKTKKSNATTTSTLSTPNGKNTRKENKALPDRRLKHTSPYATFGNLRSISDFGSHALKPLLVNVHNQLYSVSVYKMNPHYLQLCKWSQDTSVRGQGKQQKKPKPSMLYVDASNHYHLTSDNTQVKAKWKTVSAPSLPKSLHCTVYTAHANSIHLPRLSKCSIDSLSTYATIVLPDGTISVFHREYYPLCLRFQQLRAYDPLKCIQIPTGVYNKHASSIEVVLCGCSQFEKSRMNKRKRTVKRAGGGKSKASSVSLASSATQYNVSTYTASLATMVQRRLVTAVPKTNFVELHLQWHYCRSWRLVLPNQRMLHDIVDLNQKRKCTVHPNSDVSYTERAFPSSQMQAFEKTRTVLFNINDDAHFRCPICNQANKYRTFRDKERSAYGSLVGIVRPDDKVHLDPNWLYVCSFKLLGARIDSSAYASKWKLNPKLSAYQYSIPLQQRLQFSNLRTKTFNCGMLKVTTLDTFTLTSLNVNFFFEQSSVLTDTSFIMTGCVRPASSDLFQHQRGSLQQLWQLAIEKAVTHEWLSTVVDPAMLLNAERGHFVYSKSKGNRPVQHNQTVQKWSKQHAHSFAQSPCVFDDVCCAYAFLQHALTLDVNLLNTFYLFWHIMTNVGYQLGSERIKVHYFFFDVCQTETHKSFIPSLICPPSNAHALYWNPYTELVQPNTMRTNVDILLFAMGVKMHCQQSYSDTFYLLRRNKLQLHNQYMQVCFKSRVQYFCDIRPSSLRVVQQLYDVLQPLQKESKQMFVNAYLYYKLYNNVAKCGLHMWTPSLRKPVPVQFVLSPSVLIPVLFSADTNLHFDNEYLLHPYVLQPSHACFHHKETKRVLLLPVQKPCDPSMSYIATSAPLRHILFDTAVRTLKKIANHLPSYAPQGIVLNTIGQVISIKLVNGGQVPVHPTSCFVSIPKELVIHQPSAYSTSLIHSMSYSPPPVSFMEVWENFLVVSEKVASACKTKPSMDVYAQMKKYALTVSKTHRKQFLLLLEAYGQSPVVQDYIRNNRIQALRRYILGIYTQNMTPSPHHFYFATDRHKDHYGTEYRSTSDVYSHLFKKKTTNGMMVPHNILLNRGLPPPYNKLLLNARVHNSNGFKELVVIHDVHKDYLQTGTTQSRILREADVNQYLNRSIYLLNERRFMKPTKSNKPVSLDNSVVMITRPTLQSFDAISQKTKVHTHHLPETFKAILELEKQVHVVIHQQQKQFAVSVTGYKKVTRTNQLQLALSRELPFAKDVPISVHVDTNHHRVQHYELLKHRVSKRMKNLQYYQLPSILQRVDGSGSKSRNNTKTKTAKCTNYIVAN
jgi:hypothetical protein